MTKRKKIYKYICMTLALSVLLGSFSVAFALDFWSSADEGKVPSDFTSMYGGLFTPGFRHQNEYGNWVMNYYDPVTIPVTFTSTGDYEYQFWANISDLRVNIPVPSSYQFWLKDVTFRLSPFQTVLSAGTTYRFQFAVDNITLSRNDMSFDRLDIFLHYSNANEPAAGNDVSELLASGLVFDRDNPLYNVYTVDYTAVNRDIRLWYYDLRFYRSTGGAYYSPVQTGTVYFRMFLSLVNFAFYDPEDFVSNAPDYAAGNFAIDDYFNAEQSLWRDVDSMLYQKGFESKAAFLNSIWNPVRFNQDLSFSRSLIAWSSIFQLAWDSFYLDLFFYPFLAIGGAWAFFGIVQSLVKKSRSSAPKNPKKGTKK